MSRPVDGRDNEPASVATAFEFLGDLGVDEGQPLPVAVVTQFGEVAAVGDLESGRGLVVGDRYGIAHPAIVASAARRPGRGCTMARSARGYQGRGVGPAFIGGLFGSMREKSGRVPAAASVSNSANGTKWVARRSFSRGKWITPVNESGIGSMT